MILVQIISKPTQMIYLQMCGSYYVYIGVEGCDDTCMDGSHRLYRSERPGGCLGLPKEVSDGV